MSAAAMDDLRAQVRGEVLVPDDEAYATARVPFNVACDQRPVAIVRAAGPDDVAAAISYARRQDLGVRLQSTGHGALGDLEGCVLISTEAMADVEIDPARRVARVGAGARWGAVTAPAAGHGLAARAGSSPRVGVVGYSLGGGTGWIGRQYGLACRAITAADVVTGGGERVRVDADTEPELLWALRGGGGGLAAVCALEFGLEEVARVWAGNLIWPLELAPKVLPAWREWVDGVPDRLTSVARMLRIPPIPTVPEPFRGAQIVVVGLCLVGDAAEGDALVEPLRALGPRMMETLEEMAPPGLAAVHMDPDDPLPVMAGHALLDDAPGAFIDALLAAAGPGTDCPLVDVELRQLGGALGRPDPEAAALDHLDADFLLWGLGVPMGPAAPEAISASIAAVEGAAGPWDRGRRQMNFCERAVEPESLFAPDALARLRALRERWDPDGVLRPNHPVALG